MHRIFVIACLAACGSHAATDHADAAVDSAVDGPSLASHVIAGGGIADGPIAGAVGVYVIDDATRLPIRGATVGVGAITGVTDATGLFVATGVAGPQTIYAAATGYSSAAWVGVDGADVTIDLFAFPPVVPTANLAGNILGLDTLSVPTGHLMSVRMGVSNLDPLIDAPADPNDPTAVYGCDLVGLPSCAYHFPVTPRTLSLFAVIYDQDPNAGTFTVIGWADRLHVTLNDGDDLSGQDLALIPAASYTMVTVSFEASPAMYTVSANPTLDLGAEGVVLLPPVTPQAPMLLEPDPSLVPGATYGVDAVAIRLVSSADTSVTTIKHRGLDGTTLALGPWLAAPVPVTSSLDQVAWEPNPDAKITGADYTSATGRLVIDVFDGSTTVAIPSGVRLTAAAGGTMFAIGGRFDPQSFSFDDGAAIPTFALHYVDAS